MKLFVWDFHGVLEKDNDLAVLEISNEVLTQAGHNERFSAEDNQKYYGLKWYQYFERLLPDLTSEQHLALQAACFRYAEQNLHILEKHIKPNDYAIEVLEAIQKAGHDQIMLSNTRPQDLAWFMGTVGIQKYFPATKTFGVNAHQKLGVKKDALKHYMQSKNFDQLVIISDSEDDMELKTANTDVTYFYSHPNIKLKNAVKADYIITDLRKILEQI